MLHLYRRHGRGCPHRAQSYRRCSCPIYCKGTLAGQHVRRSLDLTDWGAATKLIGQWTTDGRIGHLHGGTKTIQEAADAFLNDGVARGLADSTLSKYRHLLHGRLIPWALKHNAWTLSSLDLNLLTQFRSTWPDEALAKSKNQERLRAFLRWCAARQWVSGNPAEDLSVVKVRQVPTLPFSTDEVERIISACDRYPRFNAYGYDNPARMKAFVLLLRWSGLRIRDVVTLAWDKIVDGKLFLYTHKTNTHVYVPLPAVVTTALEAIRTAKGTYVFWTGNGLEKSSVANWQRALRSLFKLAKVEKGHAHRFRDTFAVELLLAGVELADVSVLLGHSSVKVTERHYAPWVVARQTRLESIVQKTWQTAPAPPSNGSAPAGIPDPLPTPESASPAPASPPLARTGTADGRRRRTPTTLRLVASASSEVQS